VSTGHGWSWRVSRQIQQSGCSIRPQHSEQTHTGGNDNQDPEGFETLAPSLARQRFRFMAWHWRCPLRLHLNGPEHEPAQLSSLRGQRVVIYFYPKGEPPGWHQGGVRLPWISWARLRRFGIKVAGDPAKDGRAATKIIRQVTCRSPCSGDPSPAVASAYGAWTEEVHGRGNTWAECATLRWWTRKGRLELVYLRSKLRNGLSKILTVSESGLSATRPSRQSSRCPLKVQPSSFE